jgi:biopolymer transport protein ExbB
MSKRAWLVLVAGLILPLTASAASWWNQDWQYRKEVGFDLSAQGADVVGSPAEVPVLVRLSLANFNFFGDAKPDGSDFRVVAGDDKTPLKFHFERYDSQNQMAFLWVRVPRLTGGAKSDRIYVYYGNPKAPAGAEVAATYDNDAVLVLHFSETQGLPQDATAYKNNPSDSNAELNPASLIAGGARFAGAQRLSVPASTSLRLIPTSGFTASAWLKIEQPQSQAYVLALADGGKELALGVDGTKPFVRLTGGSAPASVQGSSELSTGQWHHLAVRLGDGQLALYVDGVSVGSAPATAFEIGGVLSVGGSARSGNFLSGEVDEVEVAKTARSADWLKAAARGEGPDSPLVQYGADGQREGGQGSYLGTILKNLTVDGWVVIGICFAMLLLALLVMVGKTIFLGRVESANKKFVAEFAKLSGDPRALDKPISEEDAELEEGSPVMAAIVEGKGNYATSTLFQIYHRGAAELGKRLDAPQAKGAANGARPAVVLTAQSIEAIRAAMDSTLTRQQQRLSSQMVLLTIAISGGPFLGLLGTVVGVMITFAAIASSGDVNVNAIAPGIAAALAATVAGLMVAIPSLFGYNWLNTRIKSINVENRVFVDEFVTRLAEQYS